MGRSTGVVGGGGEKRLLTLPGNEPDSQSLHGWTQGSVPIGPTCVGPDPAAEVPGVGSLRAGAVLGGLWAHLASSATV